MDNSELQLFLVLTIGFASASFLGYLTQKAKLSPLLGYLLAGYLIGPYSPGFVTDLKMSEQLAEIGVILMMFGVGVHFKWQDLLNVKKIAIPGAVGQTLVSSIIGALTIHALGWPWATGVIIGIAIGVASTVVLTRVLTDHHLIETSEGHIAIGWLIVEDILTVAILILLPVMYHAFYEGDISVEQIAFAIGAIALKLFLLGLIMFTVGHMVVTYILIRIARTRSHELFTLTILALIFVIAASSTYIFGTSIALGAFIAGMVIGQTAMRHQASANALPMQDIFVVLFFLSVGMLFNPTAITEHFAFFMTVLAIILVVKPLAAFGIVKGLGYSLKTALTVSIALAQIGEFSFILAQEALKLNLLPDEGYDIIVACALVSISINPLLFNGLNIMKGSVEKISKKIAPERKRIKIPKSSSPKAIVVGYGILGHSVVQTLEKLGFSTVIIEQNVDIVNMLIEKQQLALYGDASNETLLRNLKLESIKLLISTISDSAVNQTLATSIRSLNPNIELLVRVRSSAEVFAFQNRNIHTICAEEEEIKAFTQTITKLWS